MDINQWSDSPVYIIVGKAKKQQRQRSKKQRRFRGISAVTMNRTVTTFYGLFRLLQHIWFNNSPAHL